MNRIIVTLLIFFGTFCFAMIFVVAFMNSRELDCVRQPDESYTCRVVTKFFDRFQTSDRTFDHVVDIVTMTDDCDEGCSYRAEFVTSDGGYYPLSTVWTDEGVVLKQVNEIKSQISRQSQLIHYKVNPPWWVLYLIGGLSVMSLVIGLFLTKPARKN